MATGHDRSVASETPVPIVRLSMAKEDPALVVSWQDRQIDCGVLGSHNCPICERERPFHLVLFYRAEGFYIALS